MRSAHLLRDFRSGKQHSRKPGFEPEPPIPEAVAILPEAIRRVLGVQGSADQLRTLRALRDEGTLIVRPGSGRLTHWVHLEDGSKARAYVFRGDGTDSVALAADRIRAAG
jgi:hypothetical protein